MKKFLYVLLVVFVLAAFVVPVAFAQAENPPVAADEALTLPALFQALIAAFIGWIVTQGLKSLSKVVKYDLSGYGTAITGALVTAAIVFFNALLAAVPAEARESVAALFGLVISILSAYGIAGTIKSLQAPFVPAKK